MVCDIIYKATIHVRCTHSVKDLVKLAALKDMFFFNFQKSVSRNQIINQVKNCCQFVCCFFIFLFIIPSLSVGPAMPLLLVSPLIYLMSQMKSLESRTAAKMAGYT